MTGGIARFQSEPVAGRDQLLDPGREVGVDGVGDRRSGEQAGGHALTLVT